MNTRSIFALALLLSGPAAAQTMNRCTDAHGAVTYSQTQCPEAAVAVNMSKPDPRAQEIASPSRASLFESDASLGDLSENYAIAMQVLAKNSGYRCDTISSVRSCFYGCDYKILCNHLRYEYEFTDKGGRTFIEVKR